MHLFTLLPLVALAASRSSFPSNTNDIFTYNAGLMSMVPHYESRRQQVPEALAAQDADVVCLQEIRHESDMINIMEKTKDKYKFSYSMFHETTFTKRELQRFKTERGTFKPFPCAHPSFTTLANCMVQACGTLSGVAQLSCTLVACQAETFALPQDCLTCMVTSGTSMQNIQDKCASTTEQFNRYSPEGILLLSKRPLFRARKYTFLANITQINLRGLVDGYVAGVGLVGCMHLTADLTNNNLVSFPYIEGMVHAITGIDSFEKQQAQEVATLLERYRSYPRLILTGDFNIGPAIAATDVQSAGGENYHKLVDEGHFDNLYVDNSGHCTFCSDNEIAFDIKMTIDHVLTRGYKQISAERVFDEGSPLSDHYGVKVGVSKRRFSWWW